MDVLAIARFADADPAVISGLIEEHVAARLAQEGPETWSREHARWRGVREALDAAAAGALPVRTLDRPPHWLQGAATTALRTMATSWFGADGFMTVRVLERLGLVELEHDDTYVLAVIGGIVGDPRFTATTRADVLRVDPELREAVIWRLFEVEGGGEVSLANLDKFCRGDDRRWSTTFHELVDDGTLPRDAVLTAALGALARDFSAYRAGWFSRLYRSFDPTPQESAERQGPLRHLLRSDVTATVTMALRCLLDVAKAGLLDDDETAPALGPALRHENRTTADATLALAEGIAGRRADLADVIADQVTVALGHPHAKVQERAARLMLAVGGRDRLEAHAADLSPAVAAGLGLDAGPRAPSASVPAPDAGRSLPVDAAPSAVVRPAVGTELVELMAALLEDAGDPMAVEAVLAGLAATGPTDLLAGLDKRADTILRRGPRDGVTPAWLRGQLARVVRRSAGHQVPALQWVWDGGTRRQSSRQVALRFLGRRLDEVGDVVAGLAAPRGLLATPEHPAGWIRPETLVARLASGAPTTTADTVAALLRLAPEGRRQALGALDRGELPAGARAVEPMLRHSLGGEPPRVRPFQRRPDDAARALWTAAARARAPLAHDAWAERLGLTGAGRATPIGLRLGVPLPWDGDTSDVRDKHLPWVVVDSPVPEVHEDEPTAVGGVRHGFVSWNGDAEDYVPWVATVYPADAEHLCWVAGIEVVLRAQCYAEVQHDAVRVLDALRDHEGHVGRLTQAVLVAGLSAAGVDERVRAVDAVGRLGAAGRLDGAGLGAGIVAVGPITPLARLAASLRDLASTGSAGAGLVMDGLAAALPQAPTRTRGIHVLLEVLLDELVRAGRPTPPALAPWLAQLRGGSRAATLAATLRERA